MKHRFQKGDRVRVIQINYGDPERYEMLIGEEFEIAKCRVGDDVFPIPAYHLVGRDHELWAESELELVEETDIPAVPPLSDLFG